MRDLEQDIHSCKLCKNKIRTGEIIVSSGLNIYHENCLNENHEMKLHLKIELANGEIYFKSTTIESIHFPLNKIKEVVIERFRERKSFINSYDLKDEIDSLFLNTINE